MHVATSQNTIRAVNVRCDVVVVILDRYILPV